jgi:two-component system catabolic regulation response regulator CreB/two-component system response regulator ChvI
LSSSSSANKRRILIVDDEPDITRAFKMGLEDKGFKVDIFNDSEEALSNFRAGSYDLLLLDVKMPKMNGFELYEQIMKTDNKPKVCFITAYEVYYQSLREQFLEVKIDCYIKKPIEIQDLVTRIQTEL